MAERLPDQLPALIEASLNQPLPGRAAQWEMAPDGRGTGDMKGYRDAAVLLALHRRDGRWTLPLILRAEDDYAHGGQVGFPGGRLEENETLSQCALREAEEEVGLPPDRVRLLGALTPLPVPVSRHIIHPFVGVVPDDTVFIPDTREVQQVPYLPLETLLAPEARKVGGVWVRRTMLKKIPYFEAGGLRVWGATSMVLSEFRQLLQRVTDLT